MSNQFALWLKYLVMIVVLVLSLNGFLLWPSAGINFYLALSFVEITVFSILSLFIVTDFC